MGQHLHRQTVPRSVLVAAAIMMLVSIGLAAGARRMQLSGPPKNAAPPVESIEVRFADRADGSIAVLEARSGREVSLVPPRSNGFVRGVLRGMFRTRKLESIDRSERFELARHADGRLTLTDPQTGRRIDLNSFGPTNAAVFQNLLAEGRKVTP
jgi:putative photosynthetic complex assembly protein